MAVQPEQSKGAVVPGWGRQPQTEGVSELESAPTWLGMWSLVPPAAMAPCRPAAPSTWLPPLNLR